MYVTAKGQPKLVHNRGFSVHYTRERGKEREREITRKREIKNESTTKPRQDEGKQDKSTRDKTTRGKTNQDNARQDKVWHARMSPLRVHNLGCYSLI